MVGDVIVDADVGAARERKEKGKRKRKRKGKGKEKRRDKTNKLGSKRGRIGKTIVMFIQIIQCMSIAMSWSMGHGALATSIGSDTRMSRTRST